jgi:CubicO group peptidase (beta-lactamase class C family)
MSYSCGEPGSVAEWLAAYLTPAGSLFDVNHNFAPWPPGDRRAYSNVGYGLLGLAVETVSGRPFGRYCREQILAPLGMSARTFDAPSTSAAHATAYSMTDRSAVAAVRLRDPDAQPLPASRGRVYVAHCLYSFPTVADGLLRTTANDLAQFVGAFTGGGAVGAERILRPRTVRRMFSTDGLGRSGASGRTGLSEHVQGIAWQRFDLPGPPVWGHGGSDPGVSALVLVRPATRTGVVLMSNVGGAEAALRSLGQRLLDHGHRP